ncbi:hypothetical protein IAE33_003934 [Pseudomonas sp. S60]|uniref:hypothetical protein n=1 Tax=Pseudomonas sp. S60 TaxID=211124 RepID=UPI00191477A7|nr:hypothetical protein [Pseudomonas sp. S60]MBK5012074.1 hypothetical protein [Pseudomonas sp. S60]
MTKDSGFGKVFFENKKISCIYVIPTWNHWYQYEYMKDALEIVRVLAKGFKKVVLYGVSMGGYGVLKYANYLNACDVISISPQAAVTGPQSEFDTRFLQFWNKINHKSDSWHAEQNFPLNITIFYDRYHYEDGRHARLISQHIRHAKLISLPFSGHEVFAVLNESGILSDFVFSLLSANANHAELLSKYRRNRAKSGVSWMYAARNSLARNRADSAGRLYKKAIDVIEWRKLNGLTIDAAKAKMTLLSFVEYCFSTRNYALFCDMYSRFSNRKLINVDLTEHYIECCLLKGDGSAFVAAVQALDKSGKVRSSKVKNLTKQAIERSIATASDFG